MQGGKSPSKWESLKIDLLEASEREVSDRYDILLLSETNLMNLEEPPHLEGFTYYGSNRVGPSGNKSSGGVGIIIRTSIDEMRLTNRGDDFVTLATEIGGQRWLIVSMYAAITDLQTNKQQFDRIGDIVRQSRKEGARILVAGDMNGHIMELDGRIDGRGKLLREFANQNDLRILNLSEKCRGKTTRSQGGFSSSIDYALCDTLAYEGVLDMHIDEDKEILHWSDHNLISLRMGKRKYSGRTEKVRVRQLRPEKAAKEAMEKLQQNMTQVGSISYSDLTTAIQSAQAQTVKLVEFNPRHGVRSAELSKLSRERRLCNRVWRRARNTGIGVQEAERRYRIAQNALRAEVDRLVQAQNQTIYSQIMYAPRQARCKAFWGYIRKSEKKHQTKLRVLDENGGSVPSEDMTAHLTHIATKLLDAKTSPQVGAPAKSVSHPVDIVISGSQVENTLKSLSASSATGPDMIPVRVLKELKDFGYECISDIFNRILRGSHEIPPEWRCGRVSLLEKSNSAKGNLLTYRPITISDILYRVFTKIIGKHIQGWTEETGQLSEMQNGFRNDRRGDDNLFILTSAIELARAQKKGLIGVFLDATKAYDRIDRRRLWRTLRERGMSPELIELIQLLYEDNNVVLKHGGYASERVSLNVGLKQGCPLSPILFSLYIGDLENQLLDSDLGFKCPIKGNYWNTKEKKYFRIPGLLFADDLLLLTNSWKEMVKLLEVTSNFGDERSIKFNPQKSGVMVFAEPHQKPDPDSPLKIQGLDVPIVQSYKYLGIELSAGNDYLSRHWDELAKKANKAIQRLNARSLWKFDRYEISKILWKATAVPQLTYCNAVLSMPKRIHNMVEARQRDAGRWALGIPNSKVAMEFIEGELGWSSFDAREAISKVMYFERIKNFEPHRWPKRILEAVELTNTKVKTIERLKILKTMFNLGSIELTRDTSGRKRWYRFRKELRESVRNTLESDWKRSMESKSTLALYRQFKETRGLLTNTYDNSRGSRLLALTRAGMLNTRTRLHKYDPSVDPSCPRCGAPETAIHVVLGCEGGEESEQEFARRIGMLPTDAKTLRRTKTTLSTWERQEK